MRRLIDFLPASNTADIPEIECHQSVAEHDLSLDRLIPDNANKPYDIKELILKTADEGDFFEIQAAFAKNIVTGFGRVEGRTVGFVANQPMVLAGVLDSDASRKAARFVRFCDCFNIPIVTFVDVPGFLPGTAQEYGGLIKHGAKLLFAYAEATVPKVTVITRKAFGGAYDVMASKHLRGDINYAWPTAQIAVMGAKGAVEIIYRKDIGDAEKIAAHTKAYEDRFLSPFVAAERGYVDEVIMPHSTRRRVARALQHAAQQGPRKPLEEARQHPALKAGRKQRSAAGRRLAVTRGGSSFGGIRERAQACPSGVMFASHRRRTASSSLNAAISFLAVTLAGCESGSLASTRQAAS